MSTNFPTSLDSYAGHNPGDTILDTYVDDLEDAIEAIEATVGITGSAVTTSHDYRIAQVEAQLSPTAELLMGRVYDRYNLGYYGPDETGATASTTQVQAWIDYLAGDGMNGTGGDASDFTSEGRAPQGMYLIRTITAVNIPMLRGAGARLTAFKHVDGFTEPMFRFTSDLDPNARDSGGLDGMAFYSGTHTDNVIYFDGNIDSAVTFNDLVFDQASTTTIASVQTNGISVQDYVNWHMTNVRCNRLRGWWCIRRDTGIGNSGSTFSIDNWTWDNEVADAAYTENGRGIFRCSVADYNGSFKGSVRLGSGKIEINDPMLGVGGETSSLSARNRALVYLLQNSDRAVTAGVPQFTVSLDAVIGIASFGMDAADREFRLIGTNVGEIPIHFAACQFFGISELYNNDAGTLTNELVGTHDSGYVMNGGFGSASSFTATT